MTSDTAPSTATQPQSRLTGAVALMGAQVVVMGLGWLSHPIIAGLLGRGPYGIFSVVLALQGIFGLVLTLGVPAAVSRFVAKDVAHARSILGQALRIQFTIASLVGVLVLLTSPLLARALGDAALMPYIAFVAGVLVAQSLYPIYIQYSSGLHRFNRQALLTTVYAILKLVGAVGLIFVIGVYGAFAGFAVGGILAALLGWWWARQDPVGTPMRLPVKSFLAFAGLFTLILIGLEILGSLDLLMVKALLGSNEAAGDYGAARTLARIPYLLLQGIGFVLLPSVSKLTQSSAERAAATGFIQSTIRYLIMLIVPGVALAAATSEPLIHLFYPAVADSAASALTILMVGIGALAFYLLLANIAAGAGRVRVVLGITIVLIAVSATGGWLLIPRFGLQGAAMQTTIASLLGLVTLAAYTFRSFAIPVPLRSISNVLIASVGAVSITYLWDATRLTLVPQYLVVGVIYAALLWVLKEISPADRQRIANLHPRLHWIA